ncbi:hypothetical protein EWM64_g1424 [Hericium alpestre]|uniref:Uncharacterized protein n=1 Tax=Hericium alpestre TaxID=135208 RepID=A0A4Z0A9J4_9AGAM|nr:hypothetical protein EWM64_g1424 [Hericium alpestre]
MRAVVRYVEEQLLILFLHWSIYEMNSVTLKIEEVQASFKLEESSSSAQTKAEETQQSASQTARPVARVTKRSRSEDTESSAPSKRQRTDRRNEATTEGVQKRRQQPSLKKKDGGKKKKEKKNKKTSGRPPKPPATHPSTWRDSRVPFFDTVRLLMMQTFLASLCCKICATAAMKEYRVTQHDLLDLTYDEERSKNGPAYWNSMKLYKTRDVEYRAWRKHGGPEGWEWK